MLISHIIDTQPRPGKATILFGLFTNDTLDGVGKHINTLLSGQLKAIIEKDTFHTQPGRLLTLYTSDGQAVVIAGLGEKQRFNKGIFQDAVCQCVEQAARISSNLAACYLPQINQDGIPEKRLAQLAAMAAHHGAYQYTATRKLKDKQRRQLDEVMVAVSKDCERCVRQGDAIGIGTTQARELGNLPPNICNPAFLAAKAEEITTRYANTRHRILNQNELQDMGMGALLAVGQGSANDSRIVVLEYNGAGDEKPIALVGKGVTFDSGGISLKPGANMDEMKYDMMGAGSVIGTFITVAELQLPINLLVVVPTVENMPGGRAYRPGDIITSYSGKTIEVLNTDAEGRLILCDALTYAQEFEPKLIIDVATLTGACIVALGHVTSAVMSNRDELAAQLMQSGNAVYDRTWHMPLFEEYKQQLKSPFADLKNIGGMPAGAITAATFLGEFIDENQPWAHLDIAGVAWRKKEEGATGRVVPLLSQFLIDQSEQAG